MTDGYVRYTRMFLGRSSNDKLGDTIIENPKSTIRDSNPEDAYGDSQFFTSGNAILKWHTYLADGRNTLLNTGDNADVKFYVGKAAYSTDT